MHYIIESIVVGIYCVILYFVVSIFFTNTFINTFFITGFLKHFLSYYLGLHSWYCNNGYACINANTNKNTNKNTNINKKETNNKKAINNYILIESIGEGILFLLVATVLNSALTNKYLIVFLIGFILHTIFELLGIHKYFCLISCNTKG